MLSALATIAVLTLIHGLALLVSAVSSNSFPQPLSENEENHYLSLALSGDREARHILVERNLRLVAHIIKKFDGDETDFDDLISIGTIGLIKAVNTYNPEKSARLATYASRCIENEILMHFRSRRRKRSECSLFEPIGTDTEGNELSYMDIIGTDPESVIDEVAFALESEALWGRLEDLNPIERKILILRYGLVDGLRYTQKEIARKMGISRSYVSRIEKKAITRLNHRYVLENA